MDSKKITVFIVCVLCVPLVVAQQSSILEQYRALALDYNHDLRAADKNIATSIELIQSAQADRLPKLSGNVNFEYVGNPLTLSVRLPETENPVTFRGNEMKYGASLSLLQPIYTGGKIIEDIRMAKTEHSLTMHRAELLFSSVCYQMDIQYWNTVARAELLQIAVDYRESMASLVQTIRERVEVGLADQQDLLMAEVRLNEADYQLLQAQSALETGRMALNSLIGVALTADTEVEDSIPVVVITDSLLLGDGGNRPELMIARDQVQMSESAERLTDSQFKPQLFVGIDGGYASPGYDLRADMDPNYAVYAKLSVPIFEWGKRRSERRASSLQVGAAADNYNKMVDIVNLQIRSAHISLSKAIEQVRITESSLAKSCANEQMAQERYNEGEVSIVELIEAKNYRQNSQINYVHAKASAQTYYSDLVKALHKY